LSMASQGPTVAKILCWQARTCDSRRWTNRARQMCNMRVVKVISNRTQHTFASYCATRFVMHGRFLSKAFCKHRTSICVLIIFMQMSCVQAKGLHSPPSMRVNQSVAQSLALLRTLQRTERILSTIGHTSRLPKAGTRARATTNSLEPFVQYGA
jgi:hypothetical protein